MLRDKEREDDQKEREKQVKEEQLKAGMNLQDAHNRTTWRERVRAISMKTIQPPPLNGDNTE